MRLRRRTAWRASSYNPPYSLSTTQTAVLNGMPSSRRTKSPSRYACSRSALRSASSSTARTILRPLKPGTRALFAKFFADRGTHLAAMIAYFALLSFVPLTFLALALLGFSGRADESSYLVTELKKVFPGTSVSAIVKAVRSVQNNAATLGIIGGVALLWTSLSFFSVLESAFNIVYGRPNRPFLRGKALAVLMLLALLVTLFVGLLAGSVGFDVLKRYAPGIVGNGVVAYTLSLLLSLAAVFGFLVAVYYLLTNANLHLVDVLPGAAIAAVLLEASS